MSMVFEYDPDKSAMNLDKHGVDFEDAQEMWERPVLTAPVQSKGEPRFMVVGQIFGKYWTAIVTMRGAATRLISVRRSNSRERSEYDRARNHL